MDTKLVKSDGFEKPERVPPKTVAPGKPAATAQAGSPQKTASEGRPSSSAVPLLNAVAGLGLPKDALSVALLVFTRFFSLSADKTLFGALRREILGSLTTSSPETAEGKAALEAKAIAAVIAADKGLFLPPEALERYARFLMPTAFIPTVFMPKTSGDKENPSPKDAVSSRDSARDSREKSLEEIPEPDELKGIAERQTQEDTLLDLLNYLPGKNGQRWLVFPFSVKVKGIELHVIMRVLSKHDPVEDGQLIVDVSGPKRQWRCFLKKSAGKFRADIRVHPEYSQRALNHLRKEAESFLGKDGSGQSPTISGGFSGFQEIIVQNGDRIPLWTEDLWPDYLPFVDKEV